MTSSSSRSDALPFAAAMAALLLAASVEQATASIDVMPASIGHNSDDARVTDGMVTKTVREPVDGVMAVSQTVTTMKQVTAKIGIVDDIACQTNLLALNAAMEAGRAGKLLDQIVPSIQKTPELVQEIAAASAGQSASVVQIGAAMGQLSKATQQNASASEELAATAEELTGQAEQLQQSISFSQISHHR